MYTIYLHAGSFSAFQWKITETGFRAQNVNKNVLLFALKDLFKNFAGELIFVTRKHMWIAVAPFINKEYDSSWITEKKFCVILESLLIIFCGFHGNWLHFFKATVLFYRVQVPMFVLAQLSLNSADTLQETQTQILSKICANHWLC